ncbi:MAG: helix-turn-helix transcriptional regulator [Marinoscillum sp.]
MDITTKRTFKLKVNHKRSVHNSDLGTIEQKAIRGRIHFHKITLRERDVLRLMSEGLRAEEIADCLFISPFTVKTHQKNILKKSTCLNSIHLVASAVRAGYI